MVTAEMICIYKTAWAWPTVPAVHDDGPCVTSAELGGPPNKGEHGQGVLRHAHIGPLRVVVLHHSLLLAPPPQRALGGRSGADHGVKRGG